MPLTFNAMLREAGLSPEDVVLVRHADKNATPGRNPYELWRDRPSVFEEYQRFQKAIPRRRPVLRKPFWAVFLSTPDKETMFVGVYSAKCSGLSKRPTPMPQIGENETAPAGTREVFELTLTNKLREFTEKLFIDWVSRPNSWAQNADTNDKPIIRLITASAGERTKRKTNYN